MSLESNVPRHPEMCKAEHGGRKSKLKFQKKEKVLFIFLKKSTSFAQAVQKSSAAGFVKGWHNKREQGAASSQAAKGTECRSGALVRVLHINDVVAAKSA